MTENQYYPQAPHSGSQDVAPLSMRIYRLVWSSFRIPLHADFRFDPDVPLIVTVTFKPKDQRPVTWRISRELLYGGLMESSGVGDVQVWPVHIHRRWMLRIGLKARGTFAVFEVDLRSLEHWLHDTYAVVPMGEELNGLEWNAVIADLLGHS
ncbi:SsgA family sporulation/cell division regulator [Streptomyces sp. NPDC008222]|uniref:SsgA family sporulation/cell division regulator n=1 Tax=Streptomyces sp. NPDC008222 TaxID=3364820 RepID=UPI0036E2D5E3